MPHLPLLRIIVPSLVLSPLHDRGAIRRTCTLPSWCSIRGWALHFPGLINVFLAPGGLQFTVERKPPWSREAKEEMGTGCSLALGYWSPFCSSFLLELVLLWEEQLGVAVSLMWEAEEWYRM